MHDGVYQTLWDVVNHYNFGGATGPVFGHQGSRAGAAAADRRRARRPGRVPARARRRRRAAHGRLHQCDDGQGLLDEPMLRRNRCCRPRRLAPSEQRQRLAERSEVARGLLEDGDGGGRAAGQRRIVEVDLEQAEAAAVAVRPLEVVDQRPVQVADDVDALGAGAVDGVEVRAQEVRALDVAPVGDAVLGDEQRPAAARVADQQPVEALGVDLPAEIVARLSGRGGGLVGRAPRRARPTIRSRV